MLINIHTKNLTLKDDKKAYIQSKIEKIAHYSVRVNDESTEVRVEVNEIGLHTANTTIQIQVTMFVPNSIIRAEDTGTIVEEATDKVVEKLKKQIERYKAKLHRRDKKGKWIVSESVEEKDSEEFEIPKIIRRKRISKFIPMHEEEAIEQMELLGHVFFLFLNADTHRPSVIYKRKDGYYGIIEPQTGEDFDYFDDDVDFDELDDLLDEDELDELEIDDKESLDKDFDDLDDLLLDVSDVSKQK